MAKRARTEPPCAAVATVHTTSSMLTPDLERVVRFFNLNRGRKLTFALSGEMDRLCQDFVFAGAHVTEFKLGDATLARVSCLGLLQLDEPQLLLFEPRYNDSSLLRHLVATCLIPRLSQPQFWWTEVTFVLSVDNIISYMRTRDTVAMCLRRKSGLRDLASRVLAFFGTNHGVYVSTSTRRC